MTTPPLLPLLVLAAPALAQPPAAAPSADKIRPIEVGVKVPAVDVRTIDGVSVPLRKLLAEQPTALVFYRGGWCPYCNTQMAGLQKAAAELKALGYRIIAVSPDRPEELKKSVGKNALSYTLLSDSPMGASRAFGIAFTVDDATISKYKGYGIDLEAASGQNHHQLPVPSVFLVGKDGIVRYRYANPDYRVRLSTGDLLAAARENAPR